MSIPVPVYLEEVVHRAVEEPLDVHLVFSSEGKPIESQGRANIGKYGLYGGKPSVVDETACEGVYLLFHLLGKALWFSLKEVNLSRFRAVGISQTFLAEMTEEAVGLVAPELDGCSSSDSYIAAVAVEAVACRADAIGLIIADSKLIDGEGSGGAVICSPILVKAFLVSISP